MSFEIGKSVPQAAATAPQGAGTGGKTDINRRVFIVAVGSLVLPAGAAVPPPTASNQDVLLDRYQTITRNPATNTLRVEAVEWTLSSATVPGKQHLFIWADILTIADDIVLKGFDLYIVARRVILLKPTVKIDTSGDDGKPKFESATAKDGEDGTTEAVAGGKGGAFVMYVTEFSGGVLDINTSGGRGSPAQNGGRGLQGEPGTPGTLSKGPGESGPGKMGGNAGRPGDGGDAGFILISVEMPPAHFETASSRGGSAGTQGSHGKPGDPGPEAPEASDTNVEIVPCIEGPV